MKSFRNPKYIERYEDVVFDLEQAINVAPANNATQTRNNLKFKSRLSLIVRVNVVLNRTVVVDSD